MKHPHVQSLAIQQTRDSTTGEYNVRTRLPWAAWLLLFLFAGGRAAFAEEKTLLTVAEQSNFRATSHYTDVVAFCQRLAKLSPFVRLGELGTSVEGRKLPLLILAEPPVATPEEAVRSKKLVVYAQGNIHAGEVDGKEGLLLLARDLATAPERPLLKDLIIVFAPIFNADGNERFSKTHRPEQDGPAEGMGIRENANGFDLNRDFVKLETPEVRSLVRFMNQWHPAIVVDCHTTDGSYQRNTLTYEGPRCPAGDPRIITFVRDTMLPDVGKRLEKLDGFTSFFYGNFSRDRKVWETVPATPRYSTLYVGLRNRIGILSESYSHASYKDRVIASRDFVRSILEYTDQNKDRISKLLSEVQADTIRKGNEPAPDDKVALRCKQVPLSGAHILRGYVEESRDGRRVRTDKPHDYPVQYLGACEPTLSVSRPYAYLFPAAYAKAVETLQRHGIDVEQLREDIELDLEVYPIDQVHHSSGAFQKHHLVRVEATARPESRRLPAGTILVKTGQALGDLVVYLLEPQSEDGLVTWNLFDDGLAAGKDFAVVRLPKPVPLTAGPVRPLAEDRTFNRPITFEPGTGGRGRRRAGRGGGMNFNGSPITDPIFAPGGRPAPSMVWLEDGKHFLQVKSGRLYQVEALTGRAVPFHDPDKLARGLATLPTIKKEQARALARRPGFHMNPRRTGALYELDNDLYYCNFDGTHAVRLTKSPGKEEYPTFSPDGRFVAFIRDRNLYVVDIATQTERALTTDREPQVSNGKPDWVYGEEVYLYQKAYWWSPDSRYLAFVQFDDRPVNPFTVVDQVPARETVENTPYPRAGEPNPVAKFGIVPVAGDPPRWVDRSNYSETASLITRAGWTPDSQRVFFYVQDRAQTWLDFCSVGPEGGTPKRLFRETTQAWVNDPGDPHFLPDGSFLMASERTGWRHLYHFDKDGKVLGAVTSGPWEVRSVYRVDPKDGWVYFSGTHDSPIALNLYRARLDASGIERLTAAPGDHQVEVSPKGDLFIDTWNSHEGPAKVHLSRTDGSLARVLDTNPVYSIEEYRFGKYQLVQIPMPDGFMLEGSLVTPPDFDPNRRYPVWFMTYGGPHDPAVYESFTVHDRWENGHLYDQMLAQMGLVVFRCDPRSASGKGACSAWSAYRKLGVQELKDIEAAIGWLCKHSFIDKTRIGMSGHSYGGFMTAYALTHSKLFAAGIAGAPVTDWHNYDSIYTERYMNSPQENPDGYEKTSVIKAARNLHGKLLLIHGLIDDNVHLQNTVQFIQALQEANKDFEVMIYPRSRHGIFGPHYQRLIIDFIKRTVLR
jgi:dipeptidyl aminopeptidase/acylaminoacyl peptidase